jgi:alkane 1-monooxygenase
VRELSSWNSDKDIIFNWLSFRFQRYSDHHMNAYKYYSISDLTPAMPRFAFSIFEGIMLTLIPPLWYYIMNP